MQISDVRLLRIVKKMVKLGPKKSFNIIQNRVRTKIFTAYWRHKALKQRANHTWNDIVYKYDLQKPFNYFVKKMMGGYSGLEQYLNIGMNENELCAFADDYVNKKFDILGSGVQQFDQIPWHIDFRLKKQNPCADYIFPCDQFYQDFLIGVGEGETFSKDIKIPWELSRCQHVLVLAQAFKKTGNNRYAQAFQEHISDWIKNNLFMLGPNWVCPMEVGLRALNWIIAAAYFESVPFEQAFWQDFVSSLYDHMFYLENNWEIYDGRTSNHYLSDLVGYLYLCHFFRHFNGMVDKFEWCFAQIVAECEKQVFAEGTSYEGSTAYHRLVTELFVHAYLVARVANLIIPPNFKQKIAYMLEFIDWCIPVNGTLITIGDNDSGCVTLAGITQEVFVLFSVSQCLGRKNFPEFGLSVIKSETLHITLRHHSYQSKQPSGHFHNDVGSITLAIKGISIFIDPGSYVYTPSRKWRNNFRSVTAHNTIFLDGHEPVSIDDQLFSLQIPEKKCEILSNNQQGIKIENRLYEKEGIAILREINLSADAKILYMHDYILNMKKINEYGKNITWNFIISPEIQAHYKNEAWHFFSGDKFLAIMSTDDVEWSCMPTWHSPAYGQKRQAICLQNTTVLKRIDIKKSFIIRYF